MYIIIQNYKNLVKTQKNQIKTKQHKIFSTSATKLTKKTIKTLNWIKFLQKKIRTWNDQSLASLKLHLIYNLKMSFNYLYSGMGYPWAGHRRVTGEWTACSTISPLSPLGTLGMPKPTGAVESLFYLTPSFTIQWIGKHRWMVRDEYWEAFIF